MSTNVTGKGNTPVRIRWIHPLYGFGADQTHIAAPESARKTLTAMAADMIGSQDLVAIYVPEGTEDVYLTGAASVARGRVVGAVRLPALPLGRRLEDYYFDDWDGSRRWPIGWPCEVVYAPPLDQCPLLRDHVELLFGSGSFGSYVARFQKGSFSLEPKMQARLSKDFEAFKPI